MAAIDHFYRIYRDRLYSEGKWVDFGSDTSIKVLGAFVALGEDVFRAKEVQIFGATSALIAGTRDGYQKEVLFDKTLPALIKTMNQARVEVLEEIHQALTRDASLPRCLALVEKYFEAGGLVTAINIITAQDANDSVVRKALTLSAEDA